MVKTSPLATRKPAAILNVNLRPFFITGIYGLLFITPFSRGLFFQPELLTAHMITAVIFALACYDQSIRCDTGFKVRPLDYALLALLAAYLLSLITAVHLRPAIGEVLKILNYGMIYYVACRAVRDERSLDRLLFVIFCAGVGVAVVGIGAATGFLWYPGAYDGKGVISSTLQYKNSLAVYLTLINILGLALSVKTDKPGAKVFYAVGNLLLLVVILGTQSRGGMVLYPAAFGLLLWGLPGYLRWRAAYHLGIVLGAGFLVSSKFMPLLKGNMGLKALAVVVAGMALAGLLQAAYHVLEQYLEGRDWDVRNRRLVITGGSVYLLAVVGVYVMYTAFSLPFVSGKIVPAHVAQRLETIPGESADFSGRVDMYRDAVRLALDHPVTGVGGGGWNALYHRYQTKPYWSTEVHNYFAQTWVEAGTIGLLAVVAVWTSFIIMLVRMWRRRFDEGIWVSLLAAGVAALTLGVHSAFDFDLSLAALGMLLWVLFGAVRAGEDLVMERPGKKRPAAVDAGAGRLLVIALVGTVLAAALFFPAASFYRGGLAGAAGARAILNGDLDLAEQKLLEARRLDPFTASYALDLAQVYTVRAVQADDAIEHLKAVNYADKAAELEPYNIQIRSAMVNVYLLLREIGPAVREAEALLDANPLMNGNYEILNQAYVVGALYYLELGKKQQAAEYIEKAGRLPEAVEEKNREIARLGGYGAMRLKVTPVMKFYLGQAEFLKGSALSAAEMLEQAYKEGNQPGVDLWLAAAYQYAGRQSKAGEILNDACRKDDRAKQKYESIEKLFNRL